MKTLSTAPTASPLLLAAMLWAASGPLQGQSLVPSSSSAAQRSSTINVVTPDVAKSPSAGVDAGDTLGEVYNAAYTDALRPLLVSTTLNTTQKAVASTNIATTAPDAFATRIHSSFQDYLNLLSFAINKVDEAKDGQSLIIRFNPVRQGASLLAATLTLSKPTIYQPILDAVPEATRPSVEQEIGKTLSDLEDATFAASYSLSSSTCSFVTSKRCFGRNAALYRDIVNALLDEKPEDKYRADPSTLAQAIDIQAVNATIEALRPAPGVTLGNQWFRTHLKDFAEPELARQLATQKADLEAAATAREMKFFKAAGFGVLENLVDNQPQFSIEGTYRSVGQFEGPDEWTAGVEWQWGQYNVNRLIRESQSNADAARDLLKRWDAATVGDSKFVLSVNYKHRAPFAISTLQVTGSPAQGFTPLDQKSSAELSARLQWGTKIDKTIGGKKPRFDFLFEGLRTWEDAKRTKNRWVGTATLTVPMGDDLSIPVSLNYANKAEFLSQQNKKFGAHLGITYRIPGLSAIK